MVLGVLFSTEISLLLLWISIYKWSTLMSSSSEEEHFLRYLLGFIFHPLKWNRLPLYLGKRWTEKYSSNISLRIRFFNTLIHTKLLREAWPCSGGCSHLVIFGATVWDTPLLVNSREIPASLWVFLTRRESPENHKQQYPVLIWLHMWILPSKELCRLQFSESLFSCPWDNANKLSITEWL